MISEQMMQKALDAILDAAQPSSIIVFGSYGRENATEDSDLDLMVIEPEVHDRLDEIVRLRAAIGDVGAGVDVLVYSKDEVAKRQDWCTSPVYWALREGRVLYESSES